MELCIVKIDSCSSLSVSVSYCQTVYLICMCIVKKTSCKSDAKPSLASVKNNEINGSFCTDYQANGLPLIYDIWTNFFFFGSVFLDCFFRLDQFKSCDGQRRSTFDSSLSGRKRPLSKNHGRNSAYVR